MTALTDREYRLPAQAGPRPGHEKALERGDNLNRHDPRSRTGGGRSAKRNSKKKAVSEGRTRSSHNFEGEAQA
jgi:hypothetical protein